MEKPRPPLSDLEVQDELHRMAFDLEHMRGETVAGDTALKASRGALITFLMALINASERRPPPSPDVPPDRRARAKPERPA